MLTTNNSRLEALLLSKLCRWVSGLGKSFDLPWFRFSFNGGGGGGGGQGALQLSRESSTPLRPQKSRKPSSSKALSSRLDRLSPSAPVWWGRGGRSAEGQAQSPGVSDECRPLPQHGGLLWGTADTTQTETGFPASRREAPPAIAQCSVPITAEAGWLRHLPRGPMEMSLWIP